MTPNIDEKRLEEAKRGIVASEVTSEMKKSYLDYAMSVIVSRAIPSIEDGLKPVQRRILYAMQLMGLKHNTATKKSARVVGDVIGKYHPHGDSAVYEAMVRLAQDFSLRYPLVYGQGNFGSLDGDPPAAMRYCVTGDSLVVTERGLKKINSISDKEKINLKILSKDKKINNASKWFDSGNHETLKITTNKGYSVTGTKNHPILILSKDGFGKPVVVWKLLEDVEKGDIAIIDRREDNFWPEKEINLENYFPLIKNKKQNKKILPKFLNKKLASILGFLIAEGTISENKIEFCNSDKILINLFRELWEEVFPDSKLHEFKRKPSSYGKKEYFRLECHCRYTLKFLRNIGLLAVKSSEKDLPDLILSSPKSVVSSFLSSYFEGDGSISYSKKMIELSCCSKSFELIKKLQILFLRYGIDSFKRFDNYKKINKLYLRGKRNLLRFYKSVNFISERKRKILEFILANYKKESSMTDFVPFISDFVRSLDNSEFISKNNFDRYNKMSQNYQKVSSVVMEKTGINVSSVFEYFLTYNYLFEPIVKIENSGIKRVYSIKVDSNCHSFVSNGFINHNTETKLQKISVELLEDIDKETVNFVSNYDNSLKEPELLPGKLPSLMLNGATGIAVGMATNIPPHNLSEVCDALVKYIEDENVSLDELLDSFKGPDFPTGGQVQGDMKSLYETGRGRLVMRGKVDIEDKDKKKTSLIIKEIPYMVNKARLVEQIANLVRDKKIKDVSDLRDESNKGKIRVVLELKKGTNPQFVMNALYKYTKLQDSFNVNFLALVRGKPKILGLLDVLKEYVFYRKAMVTNRSKFELKKAKQRQEIVEGLLIALDNLDEVIKIIRFGKNPSEELKKKFKFSDNQVKALLETRLRQLTSLESDKLKKEEKELLKTIERLEKILGDVKEVLKIIKKEVLALKESYGDSRRTQVFKRSFSEISEKDLVADKDVIVSITDKGYVKRMDVEKYRQQRRGGRGVIGSTLSTNDFAKQLLSCSTHDHLMFFTSRGRVLWLKAYDIPEAERQGKGRSIANLLGLRDEFITKVISVENFEDSLIMATKKGIVKKISLNYFSKPRSSGVRAINLPADKSDIVIGVEVIKDNQEILLATRKGKAIKFNSSELRSMGRASYGVTGIKMAQGDEVVSLEVLDTDAVFTITRKGYGKRTSVKDYRKTSRAGKGVINVKVSDKTGEVVNTVSVNDDDSIIITTSKGIVIRTNLKNIRVMGRATQGVRVVKLQEGDKVSDVVRVVEEESH